MSWVRDKILARDNHASSGRQLIDNGRFDPRTRPGTRLSASGGQDRQADSTDHAHRGDIAIRPTSRSALVHWFELPRDQLVLGGTPGGRPVRSPIWDFEPLPVIRRSYRAGALGTSSAPRRRSTARVPEGELRVPGRLRGQVARTSSTTRVPRRASTGPARVRGQAALDGGAACRWRGANSDTRGSIGLRRTPSPASTLPRQRSSHAAVR